MIRTREHGWALALALAWWLLLQLLSGNPRVEALELGFFDLRSALLERPTDLRIRPVGLDEELGSDGWSAPTARRLLGLLAGGGVRGVYVMDPPASGWAALEGALVGFPVAAVRAEPGTRGLPSQAIPTGSLFEPEVDGVVRRIRLTAPGLAGPPRPGPSLLLLAALKEVPVSAIRFKPGGVEVGSDWIPTDSLYRVWVHFPGGSLAAREASNSPLHPIPAARFLKPQAPVLRRLEGCVALLGNFADEARDEVLTGAGTLRAVQVESALLDTLLSGPFVRRPPQVAQAVLPLLLAGTLACFLPLLRPMGQAFLVLGLAAGSSLLNLLAFRHGWWLDLFVPQVTLAAVLLSTCAVQFLRSRRLVTQFLAPELAREVLVPGRGATLGGQQRVCTVMFFSLPGCLKQETWDPETLLDRRNQFTSRATDIIQAWGGRVMDFQGDAQMVLFGAPRELPGHAAAATGAALEILEAARPLVRGWGVEDPASASVHAGVCTGPLAVGFVGSEQHKEFAAIGDTTNVAARLYAAALKMKVPVLVSETTMSAGSGAIQADPLPPLTLKGKSRPVQVFRAREVHLEAPGR